MGAEQNMRHFSREAVFCVNFWISALLFEPPVWAPTHPTLFLV